MNTLPLPLMDAMTGATAASLANLRAEVAGVRYGPPGTLVFDFRGVTYTAPEPHDVMPVGTGEASRAWAVRQLLDGNATGSDGR